MIQKHGRGHEIPKFLGSILTGGFFVGDFVFFVVVFGLGAKQFGFGAFYTPLVF